MIRTLLGVSAGRLQTTVRENGASDIPLMRARPCLVRPKKIFVWALTDARESCTMDSMMNTNVLYTDRFRNLTATQLVAAKGDLVAKFDEASANVDALGARIRSGANGTAKMKKSLSRQVKDKVEAETAIAAIDTLLLED